MFIRPAAQQDQAAILALVRTERLNPTQVHWPNFILGTDGDRLIGAVQLRKRADGSRELGSLIVREEARGKGVAARLIDALLTVHRERVFMITGAAFVAHYQKWGFQPIAPMTASSAIRFYYFGGLFFGGACSLLQFRRVRRLAVLVREARNDNLDNLGISHGQTGPAHSHS